LPREWYSLPEETDEQAEFVFSSGDRQLKTNILRIFSAQRKALMDSENPIMEESFLAKSFLAKNRLAKSRSADWVPWRLAAFATDLAVSIGGQVGVLAFKGTPSVSVIWRKREKQHRLAETGAAQEGPSPRGIFRFSETQSDSELKEQIESIYRMAKASGKIKKSKELRKEVRRAVVQFREMGAAIGATPLSSDWYASHLRMDLEISAEGRIKWGTVGGAIGLRLEWERVPALAKGLNLIAPSKKQAGLFDLVGAIASDLELTQRSWQPVNPRFEPTLLIVGLAINASGNIGIARASVTAAGIVYFSRTPEKMAQSSRAKLLAKPVAETSWWLIDDQPKAHLRAKEMAFTRENGIESIHSMNGSSYRIERERFRAGLRKAFQIGDYFAARAAESSGTRPGTKSDTSWAISEIRPGFTMSIGGGLGLATLTGSAEAVLILQDKNF
jgi:hypothetical protein